MLGGLGFVGASVCAELRRSEAEIITASRSVSAPDNRGAHVTVDRRNESELKRVLADLQPDILVDLACYQPAEVDAVVRTFKGTRYLFMSTGVYPNLFGKTATEGDFVPLSGEVPGGHPEYMEAKRWCETALARHQGFPWTVIRPPAIFGAHDPSLRIVAYIVRLLDGGPLLVPRESFESRAGCAWVHDVGRATALACDLGRNTDRRAYNVSFGAVTFKQILEAFARGLDRPIRLLPVPYRELPPGSSPYGPNPDRSAGYDITRARQELGFEPSALEAAVADTLAWYHDEHPSDPGYASRGQELALAERLEKQGTSTPPSSA
ncbi:MAG: hypothetical protein NVSMB29_11610 [Candidatus Dormibacteria bacterium]